MISPVRTAPTDTELFDLVADSVIVIGLDGRITGWNRAAEALYGRSSVLAVGSAYEDMLGDQNWPGAPNRRKLKELEPLAREIHRLSAAGKDVIVKVRHVLRRDQDGNPRDWLELGTDLTAQRRGEWMQKASQAHYDNVFEAIPVGVTSVDFSKGRVKILDWLKDVDVSPDEWLSARPERTRELMESTYLLDINQFTLEMFRTDERTDMLTSVSRFWPDEAIPDYKDWVVAYLAGDHNFSREVKQRKLNGEVFDTWFTTRFAPGTVEQARFIATVMDYTEFKNNEASIRRSEAFYTDMFHGSAFSAWRLDASGAQAIYSELRERGVTDLRGALERDRGLLWRLTEAIRIVDLNETSVNLFEGKSRFDMIGSSITPLWSPREIDALVGGLEATFNDIESYKSTAKMQTLTGREIDVLFTLSWSGARHEAGELLLAVVDMTDKVQAQNALVETQAALAHAARVSSLGELTASIAHEVKQPLAAMTANGGAALVWLSRPVPDLGECRKLIEAMIADAKRASNVVAHVRSMASPQAGKYSRVSLSALVDEAMKLLAVQLQREGIATTIGLCGVLPEVMGDKVQLQQVVVNLVLNASQAMAGMPTPKLRLRTMSKDDDVILTVEDNGPGIPEEDLDKLFGSFFTTKADGMGIGLAICRTIAEAHGGVISAHNLPEGGACFAVRLPRAGLVN